MLKNISKRFIFFRLGMTNPINRDQPEQASHIVDGSGTDLPPDGASVISLTTAQLDALLQKAVDSALASKNPGMGTPSPDNLDNPEIGNEQINGSEQSNSWKEESHSRTNRWKK